MRWWRRGLAKLGIRTAFGRDAVGAGLLALWQIGNTLNFWVVPMDERLPVQGQAALSALSVLAVLPIAWRRQAPVIAFGVGVVLETLAFVILFTVYADLGINFQASGSVFLAYAVAAYRSRATAIVTIASGAALLVAAMLVTDFMDVLVTVAARDGDPMPPPIWLATLIVVFVLASLAVPGLLGGYVQTGRQYVSELESRAEQAEREREARASTAVAEERGRIARELHDIAAHHLSGIVVQAGAAERLFDRDPNAAKESIAYIRQQGKSTLANMRLVVGILRGSDGAEGAPQPGLADVEQVIADVRAAGAEITFAATGAPIALGPTADLTAYRVLQEALSNARRHAPGAAIHASVDYTGDMIEIIVRNDPPPAGPLPGTGGGGHGLVGMRERAALVSGRLEAGPCPDGGWQVLLRLPRGGV